ncbi:major facilitator superfamily domain-containing protein [Cokeromyces recurvatus]|uniref:major facilitator superfamily domain-containing protein n=1 Tax=Cokeromyces recurvatus TaxID=90255 RepID=UPI0022206ADD|nr:major facilitator superfamily domain-containing protein [Cokeromyces recurvatus]KAI7908200.1 major facilitator superfamily domain-containing protein [Cokeromyces recurvatus]
MNKNIRSEGNKDYANNSNVDLPGQSSEDTHSINTTSTKGHHHGSHSFKEDHNDSRSSTIVHRNENHQRGFIKTWFSGLLGDIYAEDNPREYSTMKKNIIIFIVALSGISGPIGSMLYMPGLTDVSKDLHASLPAINATVAAYVALMGIAPLFWASMSDTYGRKPMYIFSLIISLVAAILCAISSNIGMLIAFRAIQACGSGAGQTLGAGVIADTFDVANRGRAYGIFYIGPLLGPVIGPTIGGILCQYLGWRSSFYFLAILAGVLLLMVTFLLPETLRKKHDSEDCYDQDIIGKKKQQERFKALKNLQKAFAPMLVMVGDPTVCVITFYNTIIFACLYFLTPTITETFERLYNYTSLEVGLCYLAFGVGLMCGSVLSGQYADFIVRRLRKSRGPENVYPELRLRAAYPAFILIPAGYLIYGWTTHKGIGVYAPLIGLFIYALGQMSAFTPTSVYLVDSKPGRSATAVAINNCVRSIVAAVTTIFSSSCLNAIGPGILYTILAAINVANCVTLLIVMVFGKGWRTAFEKRTGGEVPTTTSESQDPSSKEKIVDESSLDTANKEKTNSNEYDEELAIVHSRMSQI